MLVIAGWSLTACDESHNDYVQPTVYPQPEAVTIEGFEATPTAAASQDINLGTMTEDAIQKAMRALDLTREEAIEMLREDEDI